MYTYINIYIEIKINDKMYCSIWKTLWWINSFGMKYLFLYQYPIKVTAPTFQIQYILRNRSVPVKLDCFSLQYQQSWYWIVKYLRKTCNFHPWTSSKVSRNRYQRKIPILAYHVHNPLWHSDATWRHNSESTLAQVMACWLPVITSNNVDV